MGKELEQQVIEQAQELAAANEALRKEVAARRRAEEALRLSEELLHGAFDQAPIGMTLTSLEGRWLRVNHAFCRMLGYAEQELLNKSLQSFTHPEDLEENLTGIRQLLAGRIDLFTMDKRFFRKDRQIVWVHVSATLVRNAEGSPLYFVAQMQEITESKRIHEQLRQSEERFRQLAENVTEVFWMTDPGKNELLYISPAYEKIWGRSCESVYRQPMIWIDAIHPEDRERVRASIAYQATGSYDEEYRIIRPDGSIRWIRDRAYPIKDDSGRVYRVTGIAEDITERKRAGEALKESEARLRMAIHAAQMYTWDLDLPSGRVVRSGQYREVYGADLPFSETSYAAFLQTLHPEDRKRLEEAVNRAVREKTPYRIDFRVVRSDGNIRWLETQGQGYSDGTGRVVRMIGVTQDITERKQAEERIRFQAHLLDVVEQAVIATDTTGAILYWNHFAERLYGWSAEEVLGRNVMEVTPSSLSYDQAGEIMNLLARGEGWSGEFLVRRRDGTFFTAMVVDTPIRNEKGELIGIIGVSSDMTERKRAETERDHHAAQLQGLADASLAMNSALSLNETLKIVTDRAREIIGAHMSVTGMTVNENWAQAITVFSFSDKYTAFRHYDERPDGSGIYSIVCQTNRPMRMTQAELEAHPRWRGYGKHAGEHPPLRGWLAAPLAARNGKNIGLIQLSDKYEGDFTQQDEAILVQMAQLASIAIENARLYEALEKDIQNRKKTEERLREYEKAVEGLEEMIVVVDRDYRYLIANQAFLNYRGLTREQLVGRSAQELLNPEVFEEVIKKKLDECLQGNIVKYELKYRYPKLGERDLSISYFPLEGSDGIDRVACVLQDITERKRAEEALRAAKEFSENLIQTANVIILSLDPEGKIDIFNETAEKITGYTLSELKGKNWFEILVPKDRYPRVWEEFNRLLAGGAPKTFENPILTKTGEERYILWQNNQVKVDGKVVATISFGNDITEQKQAAEALRAEHAFRKAIEESMPAGVMVVDATGRQTYVNQSFCGMVGWGAEELVGATPPFIFWPPEQTELIYHLFDNHIHGMIKPGQVELIFRRRNEERFPVSLLVSPLVDPQGAPVGYMASVHDITLLKTSQEKLARRERQLSQAQRLAQLGSWSWDLLTDAVSWSDELYRICGVDPARFTPSYQALLQLIHPQDREKVAQATEKARRDRGFFDHLTYRIIGTDGMVRIHQASGMVSVDPLGRAVSMVGVAQDITEIKKAEETLRESEERYRSLIANIPDAAWRVREDGQPVFISRNIEKIAGYTAEEIYSGGLQLTFGRIHPEDRERVMQAFQSLFSKSQKFDVEYRVQKKNGEWIWIHDRAVMTYRKEGIRYADGVVSDITERKKGEEAIRKSEERFHLIARATNDVIWDWDIVSNNLWWNESFKTIFGYKGEEIEPGIESWTNRIHPEEREQVLAGTHAVIERGGRFWSAEYRFRRADGSYATILDRGYVVHVQDGKPVRMIGAMMDITDRKRAEEALTEYAKRLRTLSGQLLEAQETERCRIARELHDEIGQSLTAVKLQLHGAKRRSDPRMEECIQMVDRALSQVRDLSLDLHPPQLDELGLVATLRWHLDRQAHAAKLISNFSADPLPARLPPDLEIACFRVAQEALTNVVRHAHANEVSIELRQRGEELHLTVEDDGEGFDVDSARNQAIQGGSLGMVGMQERAELAGGRLELNSSPGEGTRVLAIFPFAGRAPRKPSKRRKL